MEVVFYFNARHCSCINIHVSWYCKCCKTRRLSLLCKYFYDFFLNLTKYLYFPFSEIIITIVCLYLHIFVYTGGIGSAFEKIHNCYFVTLNRPSRIISGNSSMLFRHQRQKTFQLHDFNCNGHGIFARSF